MPPGRLLPCLPFGPARHPMAIGRFERLGDRQRVNFCFVVQDYCSLKEPLGDLDKSPIEVIHDCYFLLFQCQWTE